MHILIISTWCIYKCVSSFFFFFTLTISMRIFYGTSPIHSASELMSSAVSCFSCSTYCSICPQSPKSRKRLSELINKAYSIHTEGLCIIVHICHSMGITNDIRKQRKNKKFYHNTNSEKNMKREVILKIILWINWHFLNKPPWFKFQLHLFLVVCLGACCFVFLFFLSFFIYSMKMIEETNR